MGKTNIELWNKIREIRNFLSDGIKQIDFLNQAYETSNGIQANEQGNLKQIEQEQGIAAQGEFSYSAPDGTPIKVTYIADENGFQPTGDHLPSTCCPFWLFIIDEMDKY